MGFMDKLAFWKKKDEFGDIGLGDKGPDLGTGSAASDLGLGPSPGGMESPADLNLGIPQQPPMQQPSLQPPQSSFQQPQPSLQPQFQQPSPQQGFTAEKDFEVISSKLDALRAALDSINQRLANLEAIAKGEEEQSRERQYRY